MFSGFDFLESAVLVYLGVLTVLACLIAWWARGDDRPQPGSDHLAYEPVPTTRPIMRRWADDRLRLCARDRLVLQVHRPQGPGHRCLACHLQPPAPCVEYLAVIAYWQGETT